MPSAVPEAPGQVGRRNVPCGDLFRGGPVCKSFCMEPNVSAGQLLVAAPDLTDPNFDRTVVFLLDHDGSGSLGVVVNRPTELAVADVLNPWSGLSTAPD